MPDCDVLTDLLTRYRTAVALDDGGGGRETRRRVEDVAYTLCVSTGTDDIDDALTAAGLRLAEARTEKHSCPIPEGTPRR